MKIRILICLNLITEVSSRLLSLCLNHCWRLFPSFLFYNLFIPICIMIFIHKCILIFIILFFYFWKLKQIPIFNIWLILKNSIIFIWTFWLFLFFIIIIFFFSWFFFIIIIILLFFLLFYIKWWLFTLWYFFIL